MKTITVIVSSGLVQDVKGIPEGFRVKVLDYDNEGLDESHPCAKNVNGTWAFVGIWEG